jgi:Xaa-Pro aminopeptidase
VVSGKRGAYPHGTPSRKEIKKGEFVTIDFGAVYRGYCSDETCTLMVGRPTLQQKKVYEAVKEAHDKAIAAVAPGVKFTTIDSAARKVLEKAGLGKYFRHGTGHGVGLAVHEAPSISSRGEGVVEAGMVFTIEPGVYIPNWGGVRIEDMVEATRHGCQLITGIPKALHTL